MLLPIALDVKNKRCLVVGGGIVAARKVRSLLECEARVHVVAPQLCDELQTLKTQIEYSNRGFQREDCDHCFLVFACTNSREVNLDAANCARKTGALCNVADDSQSSDFQSVATIRRGEITIAVSTNGGSPALSKHLKAKIESVVGQEYAQLLELMCERRATIEYSNAQLERAEKWRAILNSNVLELLRRGENEQSAQLIDAILNEPAASATGESTL